MNLLQLNLGEIQGTGKFQTGLSDGATQIESLVSTIVGLLTVIAGIAFLIYFLLGAITWITAGGDPQKVQKAQKQMTDALIGLIAVILGYTIASIVGFVLDINILNPAELLGL